MPEAELEAVYDWLAQNRVNELLPERPTFTVEGRRLTYTSFRWSGPRGWSLTHDDDALGEEFRTVPLLVPPTDAVRELARRHQGLPEDVDRFRRFTLIEATGVEITEEQGSDVQQ